MLFQQEMQVALKSIEKFDEADIKTIADKTKCFEVPRILSLHSGKIKGIFFGIWY